MAPRAIHKDQIQACPLGCTSPLYLLPPLYPAHLLPFKQGYQRANLVSPSELALLKKIDRQPLVKQQQVFESEHDVYAGLFEGLLAKLVRVDTVQAVLVGMGDLIGGPSFFLLERG